VSSIREIEQAIEQLSPVELDALRQWFAERDAQQWDRQIEMDVSDGKLQPLGKEALDDLREGRCKDL
jgi:hypothetical protein